MLIRLLNAVTCGNLQFEAGQVVDWLDHDGKGHATARRFVEAGLAEAVEQKELGQGDKVRRYVEPAPKPATWPPYGYERFRRAQADYQERLRQPA